MVRFNQQLLDRIEKKLCVGRKRVYALIAKKSREAFLPQHLAALTLAAENGINVTRYASNDEFAQIRHVSLARIANPPTNVQSVRLPENNKIRRKSSDRNLKKGRKKKVARRGTSVFVVHGRNDKLRRAMFSFLRSVGIMPIEWRKALKMTRKGSPFVGEILDVAFREAVAVVVLLTPDDKAKLSKELWKTNDPPFEKTLTGQARPNVLFEAGMAFGRNPESTVLVQVGDVRPFSDIAGRHVVHLSNSTESRQELITKLANAGCNVDVEGTDWHSEGDFDLG